MAKNSWESFGGTSSLNQLKGYIKSGQPFEYIANKTKLLNDDVADPSKFVKEQFVRIFKNQADNLFKPQTQGGLGLDICKRFFGNDVVSPSVLKAKLNNPQYVDNLINFIKAE